MSPTELKLVEAKALAELLDQNRIEEAKGFVLAKTLEMAPDPSEIIESVGTELQEHKVPPIVGVGDIVHVGIIVGAFILGLFLGVAL